MEFRVFLCPNTVVLFSGLIHKMAIVVEIERVMGSACQGACLKGMSYSTLSFTACPTFRLQCLTTPRGSVSHCWQIFTLDPFSRERGPLTLAGIYAYFGLAFPAFAKITICELSKCLIHPHSIPCSITSDRWAHFVAKEVWQ